ncbi:hypothetical protein [Paralysiella testudinis]|uniref:DUF637 domain-containing protein n=1 Tax=Paralysiella testudinis TaxID=2809020 RepID=A0A892ZIC7_9NEIS|nr:hypothetical protein [Paralysiella testudinis]QRQ82198.1 DUF637 domain-containing protein [Paralysiella testudinis]
MQEQTGLFAGKEGFDIRVGKHTQLNGAVIASEAAPDKSRLSTETIGHKDLHNEAEYQIRGGSIRLSSGGSPMELLGNMAAVPGLAIPVAEQSSNTTKAALAEGNIEIRGDKQSGQNSLSGLSRDTAHAHQPLERIFDLKKIQERQELAQLIGEVGFRAAGDLSSKMGWAEDSPQRIALHALIGGLQAEAVGGNAASGAAAAGGAVWLNTKVENYLLENTQLSAAQRQAIQQWTAAATGAVVGGISGGSGTTALAGGAIGRDGEVFNRQLHPDETRILNQLQKNKSPEEQHRLKAAACALVQCAEGIPKTDPYYQKLHRLQAEGASYTKEQARLKSTQSDLFEYSWWDKTNDLRIRNDHGITKTKGAVNAVGGAATAVSSGVGGVGLCTTGVGCAAGAGIAALGVTAGYQQSKYGANQLLGTYQSDWGSQVVASFGTPTASTSPLAADAANVAVWGAETLITRKLGSVGGAKVVEPKAGNGTAPIKITISEYYNHHLNMVDDIKDQLTAKGFIVSEKEISFGSACGVGRCRPDIPYKTADGRIVEIIEVKTGGADLSIRQSEIFPQIQNGNAIPRGEVAIKFGLKAGVPLKYQGYPNGIPIREIRFLGASK